MIIRQIKCLLSFSQALGERILSTHPTEVPSLTGLGCFHSGSAIV